VPEGWAKGTGDNAEKVGKTTSTLARRNRSR
jgi:hypothetical protein